MDSRNQARSSNENHKEGSSSNNHNTSSSNTTTSAQSFVNPYLGHRALTPVEQELLGEYARLAATMKRQDEAEEARLAQEQMEYGVQGDYTVDGNGDYGDGYGDYDDGYRGGYEGDVTMRGDGYGNDNRYSNAGYH